MELAQKLAQRSHCVKMHVGAVLTKDTRIVSLGYNGPPAGTHNCDVEWPEHGCPRDSKGSCSLALHAEQNAILYASKNNVSVEGSTLVHHIIALYCLRQNNFYHWHSQSDLLK
jgi:dCMP deaminase